MRHSGSDHHRQPASPQQQQQQHQPQLQYKLVQLHLGGSMTSGHENGGSRQRTVATTYQRRPTGSHRQQHRTAAATARPRPLNRSYRSRDAVPHSAPQSPQPPLPLGRVRRSSRATQASSSNRSSSNRTCFHRYQYLRPVVAILYIVLAVLLANVSAFEPDFVYPLENVTVAKGRDATFTCVVNNLGGYRVAWIKADAKAILAIHEHVITNNGRLSVTHNDYNTWTLPAVCWFSSRVHPLIQVPNQLVGAPLNTDVTLICNVEASPKAINYWQRENGEMIISNERYLMNENESSMYAVQMTLVIRKLHKADMGGYKCISKNSIGDAEGTIRLYEMELQKKSKSAHRLNSVEDTSGNDEINATPNVDQLEETNKIHKNGRLYKGLQTGDNDLITSSTNGAFRPPVPLKPATCACSWCFVVVLLCALATVRFQCPGTVSLPARTHHGAHQRSQPQWPSEPPEPPARWPPVPHHCQLGPRVLS
ncbi:uncharacterized protein LOC126579731 [Anopheles aquasalis]|uniref:uncharacterized protein LOC126579731 n=1 Tax=Anopheles aquasalis TaxID=42839 RepID=UPI00215A1874|nr:uncharacterized protein LOC126579731 [Anopheles aquasalis]